MHHSRLTVVCLALFAFSANADVYKCQQADGSIVISNTRCSTGASTVKSLPDNPISAAERANAEREVARQAEQANRLEARRLAREAAEKKERKAKGLPAIEEPVAPVAEKAPPTSESLESCLAMLEKMPLDPARRSQMETDCRNTAQEEAAPKLDPNYPGGPAYVQPPYVQPRTPKPENAAPSAQ
jgi:hypothetical protein